MTDVILQADKISYRYSANENVIDGLSLNLAKGQITALVGPNGSGKSTLLSILASLIRPDSGEVNLSGEAIGSRSPRETARLLGYLPQTPEAIDALLVKELVSLGRSPHRPIFAAQSKADTQAVSYAISLCGLEDLQTRQIQSLSGGQRQLCFIAMVLAQEPEVLLLDEPTSFLDISHQLMIVEILKKLRDEKGTTIVAALHDIAQAAELSDQIAVLFDGKITAFGTADKVLNVDLLRDVFGIEARCFNDSETGRTIIIPLRNLKGSKA